jgi:hypothetical protein
MDDSILKDIDYLITVFNIKNTDEPDEQARQTTERVIEFFKLNTKNEALLLSYIIHGTITLKEIDINTIAEQFGTSLTNYHQNRMVLKDLEEQDYIYSLKKGPTYVFKAHSKLIKDIYKNTYEPKKEGYDHVIEFIKDVDNYFLKKLRRNKTMFDEILLELNNFHKKHALKFLGLNQIIPANLDPDSILYVYALLAADLKNINPYDLDEELYSIFPATRYENLKSKLLLGDNELVKNKWLKVKHGPFDKMVQPTLNLINTAFERAKVQQRFSAAFGQIIHPEKIKAEELLYPEHITSQIKQFELLVESGASKKIVKKLQQLGVGSLVNPKILLFGDPGTGKTSYAFQLAKKFNRPLYYVDFNKIKSKYYSETEGNISALFEELRSWQETLYAPGIILLNEMDGLVAKRFENPNSSMDQSYNSITNTMLDEFEQFSKGVIVATTNSRFMDPAFERRFNFKIHLTKAQGDYLVSIAKSKLKIFEGFGIIIDYDEFGKHPISASQINNIKDKIAIEFARNNTKNFTFLLPKIIKEECAMQEGYHRTAIGY